MSSSSRNPVTTIEAAITSKGQVTLPSELRKRLGLQKGSRIRFSIPASGPSRWNPCATPLRIYGGWPMRGRSPRVP